MDNKLKSLYAKSCRKIISIEPIIKYFPITIVEKMYRKCLPHFQWENGEFDPIGEDPLQLFYVDPRKIQFKSEPMPKHYFGYTTEEQISSQKPLQDMPIIEKIHLHFGEGIPWDDLPHKSNYSKESVYEKSCEKKEKVFRSIKQNGYLTQKELLQRSPKNVWRNHNDGLHPIFNEVTINVSSDGEFLWRSRGQHRLAVAQVLGIEEIPVRIAVRHRDAPVDVFLPE